MYTLPYTFVYKGHGVQPDDIFPMLPTSVQGRRKKEKATTKRERNERNRERKETKKKRGEVTLGCRMLEAIFFPDKALDLRKTTFLVRCQQQHR